MSREKFDFTKKVIKILAAIILNFMMSVGKREIPLYYKVYTYDDPNNKSMEDVKYWHNDRICLNTKSWH